MLLPILRKRFLAFATLIVGLGASGTASAEAWPFDQRNILLTRTEGQDYPDDVAVAQILDAFVKRGRVRWILRKGGKGEVLPVEVPRDFEWQSEVSVRNLGLRYRADGVLWLQRTGVRVDLRWYSTLDGKPLFFERVSLPAVGDHAGEAEARKSRINEWIGDMWSKIPGQGYVLKRDLQTASFEGGPATGLKAGDQVEIYRIELARRHPLLKTVLGINSTLSGTATVTSVGDPLTEAHIDYESEEDPIQPGDRYVLKAHNKSAPAPGVNGSATPPATAELAPPVAGERRYLPLTGNEGESSEENAAAGTNPPANAAPKYRLVDVGARAGWATFKHTETVQNQSSYKLSGGGPAVDVVARGYITRNWIVDAKFGFRHFSPQNNESALGAAELGAGTVAMQFGGAYRMIFLEAPDDPGEFTLGIGYQSFGFSVTQGDAPVSPVGKAYSGIEFRFGLKIPAREGLLVYASGARVMGASLSESPRSTAATVSGASLWNFDLGAMYRWSADGYLLGGLESTSASANFEGTGDRTVPALSNVISNTVIYGGYLHRF
jgi:hypothetical protein